MEEIKSKRVNGIKWYVLLYDLLKKHLIDVQGSDIEDLKADCEDWWNSDKTKNSWYGKALHGILGHFAVITILLIARFFIDRWFYDFINGTEDSIDEDDDDDEDDDRD